MYKFAQSSRLWDFRKRSKLLLRTIRTAEETYQYLHNFQAQLGAKVVAVEASLLSPASVLFVG
jgi:hypothetical protein